MIELSLEQFFTGALLLAFLGAGLSVYLHHRRDRRRARVILRKVIRCRLCSRIYEHDGGAGIQDCPSCGRGNVRGRDRRLG